MQSKLKSNPSTKLIIFHSLLQVKAKRFANQLEQLMIFVVTSIRESPPLQVIAHNANGAIPEIAKTNTTGRAGEKEPGKTRGKRKRFVARSIWLARRRLTQRGCRGRLGGHIESARSS